jgi:hypothetical protein
MKHSRPQDPTWSTGSERAAGAACVHTSPSRHTDTSKVRAQSGQGGVSGPRELRDLGAVADVNVCSDCFYLYHRALSLDIFW